MMATDVGPGGFGGNFIQDVWCNARQYAFDALDAEDGIIRIVALQRGGTGFPRDFSSMPECPDDDGGNEDNVDVTTVMQFYADTTCGRHIIFNSAGDWLGDGISGALVYDEFPTCPE